MQIDRRCGSGLHAVITAALQVASGGMDLVVAGGVESMSRVEFYASPSPRWGVTGDGYRMVDRLARTRTTIGGRAHVVEGGMIETAENLRREYGISREEQDRLAARSHQRAVAAQEAGVFDREIVPVRVQRRRGDDVLVDRDEHPRADTTVDSLAALRPVMSRTDPDATVTAGNASGQNDGAAMGVIELNEAFAAQTLTMLREWDLDPGSEHLNPHGSGISLGHPVGATGARILATLSREMVRRDCQWGLETMCMGGGQGLAAVFERV